MDKPLPGLPTESCAAPTNPAAEATSYRPETPRRTTVPETTSPFSSLATSSIPYRPRTRSPYARGHSRSRSSAGSLSAPQMTRAYSSPGPDTNPRLIMRPASPLGVSSRHRSPLRRSSDETHSSFGSSLDIDQTISENSELDLTPRASSEFDSIPASPSYPNYSTFPRSRRRPASPLTPMASSAFATTTPRSTLRASISNPSLANSQYNESYPSSSVPSTPTSFRSRSPSISSLETIPDSPDAEREAEHLNRLRAAAEKEEEQQEEGVRRRAGTDATGRGGAAAAAGNRDKRKRWSVCGAERRGDLNLETIWET